MNLAGERASALSGHVAMVTGCGRKEGMGRAIALALSRAGASVVVTDIPARRGGAEPTATAEPPNETASAAEPPWGGLDSLVEEIEALGGQALALFGDVSSEEDVERTMAEAVGHFGQVDILVNNAAAPHGEDRAWAWEVPYHAFQRVLAINCGGAFLCSRAVLRHLLSRKSGGRIINISSSAGRQGLPQRAAYSASKFAIIGLTQSLAHEVADKGITVNALCPGPSATSRHAATVERLQAGSEQANPRFNVTSTPVGRLGTPDDIARAVVFLADPAASHITGQSLNVDGGFIMS